MELILEPDFYSPSIDDQGNYIDKIPSFHIIKKGLYCPCGARKDKIYETYSIFSSHCKTKMHQKWIAHLNQNKMNYFVENESLKKTVENQKLVIAKMEKELHNKSITIDYLTYQIINKTSSNVVVDNLLDFD
jgi:hypothetical protein